MIFITICLGISIIVNICLLWKVQEKGNRLDFYRELLQIERTDKGTQIKRLSNKCCELRRIVAHLSTYEEEYEPIVTECIEEFDDEQ